MRIFPPIAATFLLVMFSTTSNAMDSSMTPPERYPLENVQVTIQKTMGHGLPGSYIIRLIGGKAAIKTLNNASPIEVSLSEQAFLQILNEFYKIHFFEFSDTYTKQTSVVLLDNDTVQTTYGKLMDTGSRQVCIEIKDYKKCITTTNDQPESLITLFQKIEQLF